MRKTGRKTKASGRLIMSFNTVLENSYATESTILESPSSPTEEVQ